MQGRDTEQSWLTRNDRPRLAMRHQPGRAEPDTPAVMFLHGLKSDMGGAKAAHLAASAEQSGWEFLRFDLSGHGSSDGDFEASTIGGWLGDASSVLDQLRAARVILIGSSLGGWLALLLALMRPERIAGLLLIAPAIDMTRRIWSAMSSDERATLARDGVWHRPSQWSGPIAITQAMIEEGELHCLLQETITLECPVRILHGQQDSEVPWQGSLELAGKLTCRDVHTILVKFADHRMSEPSDLALLTQILASLHSVSYPASTPEINPPP